MTSPPLTVHAGAGLHTVPAPPPPKPGRKPDPDLAFSQFVSWRCPGELLARLDAESTRRDVARSYLIRRAVERLLDDLEGQPLP